MKTLLAVTAVLAASLMAVGAHAQTTPTVGVFFDESFTRMQEDCPNVGVLDSVFVVAMNFNAFITGIEYSINYPPTMTHMGDYAIPPVTIGSTPAGISEAFGLPQNGYAPIVVAKVLFMWNCTPGCPIDNVPVIVEPHPYTGKLRATDFPAYEYIDAIGMTSLVCATVPTEETTWGRVKAMYGE